MPARHEEPIVAIATASGRGAIGIRAKDGKFLWSYSRVANGTANIPTPIISDDYVFCSTGYQTGAALLKLVKDGDGIQAEEQYFLPGNKLQNHHGQMILKDGYIYWSQGSVTNNGVVGHDNGAANCGVTPSDPACVFPNLVDRTTQQAIPCQDVLLSGNNSDPGDGHLSGGWLLHCEPGAKGQIVPAFNGAFQPGMCTGAILRAKLSNPQRTVEPVSWGYRNPFGIRFAPENHPLKGKMLVTENGEDERGARPTNNAPDRLAVTPANNLDYHGWPDRFGFLNSTQAIFNPTGGPADDLCNPPSPPYPACIPLVRAKASPVKPLALFPPQQPKAPLAIEPTDIAAVGLDFVPGPFAGGGNSGAKVTQGDAIVTREGDFGFSPRNGTPIEGHDAERVRLYIEESFTFWNISPQAAVPLTPRPG